MSAGSAQDRKIELAGGAALPMRNHALLPVKLAFPSLLLLLTERLGAACAAIHSRWRLCRDTLRQVQKNGHVRSIRVAVSARRRDVLPARCSAERYRRDVFAAHVLRQEKAAVDTRIHARPMSCYVVGGAVGGAANQRIGCHDRWGGLAVLLVRVEATTERGGPSSRGNRRERLRGLPVAARTVRVGVSHSG